MDLFGIRICIGLGFVLTIRPALVIHAWRCVIIRGLCVGDAIEQLMSIGGETDIERLRR